MKNDIAISIAGLSKTYGNGVQAIKNLSLEIPKGEFFALLGANGAGKTTTIGVMTGLVEKTSGKVKIFDVDIDEDFSKAKTYIGVVPQEFNFNMFEGVLDIVINQAGYYGIPRKIAEPKAIEILTKLGLAEKLKVPSRTLSGGMKRRLMIARALIHDPQILVLDEPTAGVDVELRIGMWQYLREINQEKNVTILLTTHYLEEVEELCNRAAIIKGGEIVKMDTVKNLVNSLDKEIYLIDIKNEIAEEKLKNSKFGIIKVDINTLEAVIDKKQTLNELINYLSSFGVEVSGIRTKGNRLEELFINILQN
jgi:ABC-2 type transport system ATP-binding protein